VDGVEFADAEQAFAHEKEIKVNKVLAGIGLDEAAVAHVIANAEAVSEALKTLNAKRRGRKAGVPNKVKA